MAEDRDGEDARQDHRGGPAEVALGTHRTVSCVERNPRGGPRQERHRGAYLSSAHVATPPTVTQNRNQRVMGVT
jgi:hypothetical protein